MNHPTLKILAPAKVNLFLQVTAKRSDGYHTLNTLMCCVGLSDVLTLRIAGAGIRIHCSHPQVPENHTNLAYRAAELFFTAQNQPGGVHIHLRKNIPVAAGLGGGSSDAAAVLLALNHHFRYPLTLHELMAMGKRIGADVPFLIHRKPAVATGIGERLTAFDGLAPLPVLLVYPRVQVSTAWVYENLNLGLTKHKKKLKYRLFKGTPEQIGAGLRNDLEEVTQSRFPVIQTVKTALMQAGALGALMSGSGSTVFGVFADRTAAGRAASEIRRGHHWEVHLTRLVV